MDTPIIAQYYRETEPEKRKELLEQAIASGEDQEANKIRKEIWEARYKGTTNEGGIADGKSVQKVLFMKNFFTESASILSDFIWIFVKKTKTITVYFADLSR